MTKGKPSQTRKNTDRVVACLNRQGVYKVLETDVICYSTRKSEDLKEKAHAGGAKRGEEIFRYLLDQIRPPVLIVHGVAAGQKLSTILKIDKLTVPRSVDEVCDVQTEHHLVIPIRSLSPQVFNKWSPWSGEFMDRVAVRILNKLAHLP